MDWQPVVKAVRKDAGPHKGPLTNDEWATLLESSSKLPKKAYVLLERLAIFHVGGIPMHLQKKDADD